jgi:hypothetical protein
MLSSVRKSSKAPWSVANFEKNRPQLTNFVKRDILPHIDNNACRRILIRGPVKSGKRDITEYIAKRDESSNPKRVHAYITSFVRRADNEQREEMKKHNLAVFTFQNKKNVDECINWIKRQLENNKDVVLHLDECDFGSGKRQLLSRLYRAFRINEKVKMVLYSATPEEVFFSGEVVFDEEDDDDVDDDIADEFTEEGVVVYYDPPAEFCGPGKFLDENLVKDAIPFFYINKDNKIELSHQGKDIITRMYQKMGEGSKRNILMLRLSASSPNGKKTTKKDNKDMYIFAKRWKEIPELINAVVWADKDENELPDSDVNRKNIKYDDRSEWDMVASDKLLIIIYDQTSSRSTEWKFHDRIFATHDYRNTVHYSIVSQAQERTNHYIGPHSIYAEFQPIEVYGHKKTFELSAGRISYSDYVKQDWQKKKVHINVATRMNLEGPHYNLLYKDRIPREYPNPLPEDQCNKILQDKGCFAEINISPRVNNTIRDDPVYETEFYECTKDTFSEVNDTLKGQFPTHNFKNPFIKSEERGLEDGKYIGYLRRWKVWDYKDVESQPGWGAKKGPRLTICYRDGVLGVALRYPTGETKRVGNMETHKSMYKD